MAWTCGTWFPRETAHQHLWLLAASPEQRLDTSHSSVCYRIGDSTHLRKSTVDKANHFKRWRNILQECCPLASYGVSEWNSPLSDGKCYFTGRLSSVWLGFMLFRLITIVTVFIFSVEILEIQLKLPIANIRVLLKELAVWRWKLF